VAVLSADPIFFERINNMKNYDAREIIYLIIQTKKDMDNAMRNLNFVNDPLLIDHYTYRYKAAEMHYEYLMEEAKKSGIQTKLYAEKMYDERYFK